MTLYQLLVSMVPSETYILTHVFIITALSFASFVGTVAGHLVNKKLK